MKYAFTLLTLVLHLSGGLLAMAMAATKPDFDAALEAFWEAEKPSAKEKAAALLANLAPNFDTLYRKVKAGRPYSGDARKGRFVLSRRSSRGVPHHYVVLVPEDYDPARSYQVRFYLHGGVARPGWKADGSWWTVYDKLARPDRILVFPSSWVESMWWAGSQVENLEAILNRIKRDYNVDENRVYLFGLSDGGTGAYFIATKFSTPWAGFLPFIGHPAVLSNPSNGVDGDFYPVNISNKPFFVINGGLDPLYPIKSVRPFLDLFERAGTEIVFRPQPNEGHNINWWPGEAANMETFIHGHVRDPLPAKLVWETERTDRYNRCHWLVITKLGGVPGEGELDAFNTLLYAKPEDVLGVEFAEEASRPTLKLKKVPGGSPAKRAGIKKGDIIFKANGVPVPSPAILAGVMIKLQPGERIALELDRKGALIKAELDMPMETNRRSELNAFPRTAPSGQVKLEQKGNHVAAKTMGVKAFKLLLSPERFDLAKPVSVSVNGQAFFHGKVEPAAEVLLKWAARDQDRTTLFAAELDVEVPAQ